MTILVTGGAGYIGSFMTKALLDKGYTVVVADSLERGHSQAIDKRAIFERGNLLSDDFLLKLLRSYHFDGVIHFAGYIAVGESMEHPGLYFTNNVQVSVKLLEGLVQHHVNNIIFSSTGTVYGTPTKNPIPESHPKKPENPYAESKWMIERILHWYHTSYGMNYMALRYFNACGAALDGTIGEDHDPETHLIPNAIHAVLNNQPFILFGEDYDTPDGTGVRDYIHVLDLVEAHLLALERLKSSGGEYVYNVGVGRGISNKEVISMVEEVSGKKINVSISPRRPGDVASTIADPSKIQKELGFEPKYSDLETIIKTAYSWHSKQR